jgi:hypothetical protein
MILPVPLLPRKLGMQSTSFMSIKLLLVKYSSSFTLPLKEKKKDTKYMHEYLTKIKTLRDSLSTRGAG